MPVQSVADNQQQGNFGAIDTEKLKQDTTEIAQKTGEQIKENWVFRTLRNTFGVKEPKKFLISLGATLATVVGCAFIGNKLASKTAKLGLKVDDKILGTGRDSIIARAKNHLAVSKSRIGNFIRRHSKTADDIADTLKNRHAKPKSDMTRGYGRGFVSIFSLTPVDILKKAFAKDVQIFNGKGNATAKKEAYLRIKKSVGKLVGKDKAAEFTQQILGISKKPMENRELCESFSTAMRNKFGCGADNAKFLDILESLKKGNIDGLDVSEFTNVNMKGGGFISAWWPVNLINKAISIVTRKPSNFGRGYLGDSLIKFNAVNGTLADSTLGRLAQKSVIVPTESISNFVNDKSGLGVLLCSSIMSTYNNAQDAPKGQKTATIADDFVGTIGSIAIATPLAFKTTYGLASLQNLKGSSFITKALKGIGKIFGIGLDKIAADGSKIANTSKFKGFVGGGLRFAAIMFVFSSLFSKPIRAGIHKIFGKPYTADSKDNNNNSQQARTDMQPVPENMGTTVQPQLSDTNLLKKWTQTQNEVPQNNMQFQIPALPVNDEVQNADNMQPEIPAVPVNNETQPQESDEIAAFNLFKKKDKRYIPKVEAPVDVQQQEKDAALQQQVNAILKNTDKVINETKKYL